MMGKRVFIPEAEVIQPKTGYTAIVNHYWWYSDEGLLFYDFGDRRPPIPQHNPNKAVFEYMLKHNITTYAGLQYKLVPIAYVKEQ